jgi:hypothetical protein
MKLLFLWKCIDILNLNVLKIKIMNVIFEYNRGPNHENLSLTFSVTIFYSSFLQKISQN